MKYVDAKGQPIWYPKKSHGGYYDNDLKVKFDSPKQKSEYMIKGGLYQTDGVTNRKKHVEKLIEEINYDNERRGLKPMTKEQCVGNGVNANKIRKSFNMGVTIKRGKIIYGE